MIDATRCAACGARMKPTDEWCSLCLTPVAAVEPQPGPTASAVRELPPVGAPSQVTPPPPPAGPGRDPESLPPTPDDRREAHREATDPGETTDPEQLGALLQAQHSGRSPLADLFRTPAVRWGVMLVGPLLIIALFLGLGALIG